MDEKNEDLILGGLPLSSSDFVEPEKAAENKNKILAAISNINKIHAERQATANAAIANEVKATKQEEVNLDNYILSKDINRNDEPTTVQNESNSEETNSAIVTETEPQQNEEINDVLSAFIPADMQGENTAPTAQDGAGEPMFVDNPVDPMVAQNVADTNNGYNEQSAEQFDQNSATPLDVNASENSGEQPMFVVGEEEKSDKKGKKEKKKKHENKCTPEEIKQGKSIAWLAYILFFIPLLINRKNNFVRHHANEGMEVFFIDILGAALIVVGKIVKPGENSIINLLLMISLIAGVVLLILTTLTKLVLIVMSLLGKEARSPWMWNIKFIKPIK